MSTLTTWVPSPNTAAAGSLLAGGADSAIANVGAPSTTAASAVTSDPSASRP
jgi:hypothetical protein